MVTSPDPMLYLDPCDVVDFRSPHVAEVAASLRGGDDLATTERCFRFVRDEIQHSSDHQRNPVTCRASDVLRYGTGFCYAKSHLLAALLRANRISAGLCYQRLTIDGEAPPLCLHGLNAVYLQEFGWYRVDPRGNREGINAQFTPPQEQLAFPVRAAGEEDWPTVYIRPLPVVVHCLQTHDAWDQVCKALPDAPSETASL